MHVSDRDLPLEGPGRNTSEPPSSQISGPTRVKLQTYVDAALSDRAKNAWWHTRNQPNGFETFSDLVEDAVVRATSELEQRHNGGKPFPARPERAGRGGRPPGR